MNAAFFETESGTMSAEEALTKSLTAGYGTNSADFRGGRALIPEDIEDTMMNVMAIQKEDLKFMNSLKTKPVRSTVHEYNRRKDVGDHRFVSVGEGEESDDTNQDIERKVVQIKYLQTRRSITDQMLAVDSFEDAYTSEKIAGSLTILKAAEYQCIHGDESVIPTEFSGLIKTIKKSGGQIYDARGKSIGLMGEECLAEIARRIHDAGGDPSKMFYPSVLGLDIQKLFKDRIRFGTSDSRGTFVADEYPTPYGTLRFGRDAGVSKMFDCRGRVNAAGNAKKRPAKPASVALKAQAGSEISKFTASDAGDYTYSVHAINRYGVSEAAAPIAAVTVVSGGSVAITITPDADNPGTGFIICRSNKGGDIVMEMVRCPRNTGETTVFVDGNEVLPGTVQLIVLTEQKIQRCIQWDQLLPLRTRPLYESNKAETPFFVQLFGALDVPVPEWFGLIDNISYSGGLY